MINKWPVFICYRQSDGEAVARRTYDLLHGYSVTSLDPESGTSESYELDVYLDQAAPAVGDWTDIHEPYLKRARAFIVICTPGAKLEESEDDWAHQEINWWLKNSQSAPVLIDALGEDDRYIPNTIAGRWPNAQRIRLVEAEWNRLDSNKLDIEKARAQERIIGGITRTAEHYLRQELEEKNEQAKALQTALDRQKLLSTRFQVAFAVAILLLIFASGATLYALKQQEHIDEALERTEKALVKAKVATEETKDALVISEKHRKLAEDRAEQIKHDRNRIELERKLSFRMSYYTIVFDRLLDNCRAKEPQAKKLAYHLAKFEYQPINNSCEVLHNLKESSLIWTGRPRRLIYNTSHKTANRLFESINKIEEGNLDYIFYLRSVGDMSKLDWQSLEDTIHIIRQLEKMKQFNLK